MCIGFLILQNMDLQELYALYLQHPLVNTDTRKELKGSIFFCLKGPNFDANSFADEALNKGAVHVISDSVENEGKDKITVVTDVLITLQKLASLHRKNFTFPVIGLTGSNGKTTNKELIAAVLAKKYKTYYTKGNLNNHIGVPLTLLSIPLSAEMAVIEMGANHQGEIRDLSAISDPDYGMITNFGKAHLEGFGGVEGVIKGKKELYKHLNHKNGIVFVNGDDELLNKNSVNLNRVLFGKNSSDYFVEGKIVESAPFISFQFSTAGKSSPLIDTLLVGSYNFYNLLAACCIGTYFKVEPKTIAKALEEYTPTNNRSQLIKTENNEIILDAYNANPSSMEAAIENLYAQKHTSKYALLGEMLELGITSKDEHQLLIDNLKAKSINSILVGNGFKLCDKKGFHWFENTMDLINYLKENTISNSLVLVKGSRAVAMEKIVDFL